MRPLSARSWPLPGDRRALAAKGGGRGGKRRWVRRTARVALFLGLAAGAAWGGGRLARALPWGYFRVTGVTVEGNLHLGREDVLDLMSLPPKANLLVLDLSRLGARLAASPWVSEATVQRRLPGQLLVRLVERAPAAVLVSASPLLLAGDGMILGEAEPEALAALPVLRAPAGRRYEVGERVVPQELNEALRAWRQVQLAPVLGGRRPREVAVLHDGSYAVRMAAPPLTVRVHPEALEPQLKRLAAVMDLRGGTLEDMEEVDLRFPEKVILRQHGAVPHGAGSSGPPPDGRPGGPIRPERTGARPSPGRPEGR